MVSKEQREPLYLEDLHVGQRFISSNYTVTEAEIKEFASKYDPQPFHLDNELAKDSLFGGLVASGWHTAAMTMRLLVTGGPQLADGAIGTSAEVTWPRPTRPGDVLQVECEILKVSPSRSRPDRGTMIMRAQTLNQKGEIVQVFTGRLSVPKRQPKAGQQS